MLHLQLMKAINVRGDYWSQQKHHILILLLKGFPFFLIPRPCLTGLSEQSKEEG
jgi:hypothetical protein